jgi:Tfp pilus assembly protein PilV
MGSILPNHRKLPLGPSQRSTRAWSSVRLFWCRRSPIAVGKQAHRRDRGFSILEVLLAALIVTSALGILASQLTTQVKSPRNASAQAAIEAAAATDLSWIRSYAQIWLAEKGPFTTTSAITKASSFTQSSELSYETDQPDPADSTKNLCESQSFTSAFLKAAESVRSSTGFLPNNSNVIADSTPLSGAEKQITLPSAAGTSTLWRKIIFAGQSDHITISYYLKVDPYGLGFKRTAAVLLDAAAWCSS